VLAATVECLLQLAGLGRSRGHVPGDVGVVAAQSEDFSIQRERKPIMHKLCFAHPMRSVGSFSMIGSSSFATFSASQAVARKSAWNYDQ
jgi:hypothetical protein